VTNSVNGNSSPQKAQELSVEFKLALPEKSSNMHREIRLFLAKPVQALACLCFLCLYWLALKAGRPGHF
jgi:hypothetical protein